jgi:hypothetical protein
VRLVTFYGADLSDCLYLVIFWKLRDVCLAQVSQGKTMARGGHKSNTLLSPKLATYLH